MRAFGQRVDEDWNTLRPGDLFGADRRLTRATRGGTERLCGRMVGRRIAERWDVVASKGATGLGAQYDAVDVGTGRSMVLHVYDVPFVGDEAALARAAAPLLATRIEGVVAVEHVGIDDRSRPYALTESVAGETLRSRLTAVKRLRIDDAAAIATQLFALLAKLHAFGVPHGNVKPENVIITTPHGERPEIRLAGLGAPFLFGHARIGVWDVGTPPYLSPEHLAGARRPDASADAWAAALVAYEMLAGERAFGGDSIEEVARHIVVKPVPRPSWVRPEAAWADAFFARALAKRLDDRIASAQGLLDAFARARQSSVVRARPTLPDLSDPSDLVDPTTDLYLVVDVADPE